MTRTYENAEELFRFASMRAPAAPQQSPRVLRLADESEVPAWLASVSGQDFAQQLEVLESRWQSLDSIGASGVSTDLEAVEALLKDLWKFYVQGIGSGSVQPQQLQRAQELMGKVAQLQAAQPGTQLVAAAPHAVQARTTVKLPAALEAFLRARRAQVSHALAAPVKGATPEELDARLQLLQALERRLAAALDNPPAFDSVQPFSVPLPKPAGPDAPRTYFFLPAADPDQMFRVANEALLLEIVEAGIAAEGRTPWEVLDALRREIAALATQIAQLPADTPIPEIPEGATFGIRPVGVADLRVVKQVLVGYDKGELAEIHNVADGATVERQHSRLQRIDEGSSDYSQRDSERWDERYTFNRNDMGRFTYATARENQDENTSVNLTGAYGEIQYNASAFANVSRGRDQQRGDDLRRSREIVDRALQLTRQSVGQSRWRFLTAETQDSTVYKLKAKCGNVVSQYRWVDQVYEAQMFNCGARAMYEVLVPNPAALFTQLLARQPGSTPFAGPAPVLPPLKASDITEATWAAYAERFGVALQPPPAATITEYAQLSNRIDIPIPGHQSRSGVFNRAGVREQGYEASIAGVSMTWVGVAGESGITASIGALLFSSSPDADEPIAPQAMKGETGDISYSVSAWGTVDQFTVNFYVVWTRTARALEQWQVASYQLIVEEYERKLSAYLAKAAVELSEVQMRTVERTELKRAVLEVIRRGTGISAPAPDAIVNGLPAIDVARLEAAAREVRFFEYAFEWDQMTYRFFPYFWASEEDWNAARFTQQGDRLFTAFLNAGFASVILPVRKGFEDAVAVYLRTGVVLDLAVVPYDDELSGMNCEVAQINAECENAVPEGEPWTYRVPTSMMVLDEDSGCALPALPG